MSLDSSTSRSRIRTAIQSLVSQHSASPDSAVSHAPVGSRQPEQSSHNQSAFGVTAFALEARMLFDGAAGASVDPVQREFAAAVVPDAADVPENLPSPGQAPQSDVLVVVDPTVDDWQTLVEGIDTSHQVLVLDPSADGVAQLADAVNQHGHVAQLHVISHGDAGTVLLGDSRLSAETLAEHAESLDRLAQGLTETADILLYGCDIGEQTNDFVVQLAEATGADIAASDDLTGAQALGGDWDLEVTVGDVDAGVIVSADAQQAYGALLAPIPTVTIGPIDPAGWEGQTPTGASTDPLLGEAFTFDVVFDNTDVVDPGFAPYIDMFVPVQGADGGGTPDGLTINSAQFLGADLEQTVIDLTAADISAGTVAHPLYTDASGQHDVTIPAGYQAGDQLIVLTLPLGSFTADQNAATVSVSAIVSQLADVGTALPVTIRSGFRYGGDALDNPSTDPTIQGAEQTLNINPQLYRVRTTYVGEENEITTGPNYVRAMRIDVDVADGNTLDNLDLGLVLDGAMQYSAISGVPGTYDPSPSGSWTNVNGVLVSNAATDSSTPGATPGGSVSRVIGSLAGTSATEDASMVVEFFVPEFDDGGASVLDAASGDDVIITAGSQASADWTPLDPRDAAISPAVTDPAAVQIEAQSLSTQKTGNIVADAGAAGLSPGDTIEYNINIDVSDFFAFGGDATPAGGTGSRDFLLTDTLSDGLEFLDSTTATPAADPELTIRFADGSSSVVTLTRGTNYTVTTLPSGQQVIAFNLRSAVATPAGLVLVGDLFGADNTQVAAAGANLVFRAQVLESYRVAPPDSSGTPQGGATQLELNEGDWIVNQAVVSGTVLDAALDPDQAGLSGETDDTADNEQIEISSVNLDIVGLNGAPLTNDPANPIRIGAGDELTYRLSYVVPTGDFEDLNLQAFLPLPVIHTDDPDADGTPSGWTSVAFTTNPGVAEYAARATGGDGSPQAAPAVTVDGTSNSLAFDFGDRSDTSNSPLLVEVFFTVRINDEPFAPGLRLSAQGVQEGQNTAAEAIDSASIEQFIFEAPDVQVRRGYVNDDVNQATSVYTPNYTPGDPTALVRPAGDGSANPLTGVLSDAASLALDTDLSGVDAGDQVRVALVLDNQGGSAGGAYDVTFRDTLPSVMDPASVTNLRLVRGDGTVISLADVRHAGGALVANEADALAGLLGAGLELVDPEEATPGAGGALARGFDDAGNPVAAGTNIIVVTYDATVRSTVAPQTSETDTAVLSNFASIESGQDFTTEDRTDSATIQTPLVSIDKVVLGTDQAFTSDNNGGAPGLGDVVVGEVIQYQVTIQVPEGETAGAVFTDTLDANRLSFVSLDGLTTSAGVSFDSGNVFTTTVPGDSGGSANQVVFNLGTITNANTGNATPDTITLTYSAVVVNLGGVNDGTLLNNSARINYTGGVATDTAPNMRVVEPVIVVTNTPDRSAADAGDTVTYTVTLNSNGATPAFDVALTDAVPAGMTYVPGSLTQTGGPAATTAFAEAGGAISAGWTQLDPSDVVTYTFQATVDGSVTLGQTLDHTAQATWTSLSGPAADQSPFTATGDTERTGTGGVNDYVNADDAPVTVLFSTPQMFLVDTSEVSSAGTTVVPGEVVRYRMVVQVPESSAAGFEMQPDLPAGIRYINDGSTTVGFVADGGGTGIDSSTLSGTNLDVTGGGANAAAIAGLVPVQPLDGSAIVNGVGAVVAPGAVMASGDQPVFRLGDLQNTDSDSNGEFVVIEFNAIVENEAVNSTGAAALDADFDLYTDSTFRATSNAVSIQVDEPEIIDVDKTVTSVSGATVTYQVTFSNTGNEPAHNVRIFEDFSTLLATDNQSFNGPGGVAGLPGTAVNNSDADTLDISLPVLASGGSVTFTYSVTATDTSEDIPPQAVEVTYTSLSTSGETLDVTVNSGTPATVTSTTTGERTGNVADHGGAQNDYRDTDTAALGSISGRLWDDTADMNNNIDGSDSLLPGITVNLVGAGANGLFGDGDDVAMSTTTDAAGQYQFGLLQPGDYRITAPVSFTDASLGPVVNYFDRAPGVTTQGDGLNETTLAEGQVSANHDFGYVRQNDAPTVTGPGAQVMDEDTTLTLGGAGAIVIDDPDLLEANTPAGLPNSFEVVLSVSDGTMLVGASGAAVVSGNGSATLTVTGTLADINATLDGLQYTGNTNFTGSDTINVTVNDHGNYGDADGDLNPHEASDDNLVDSTTVPITVNPVPDPPQANPEVQTTDEDTPVGGNALVAATPGDQTDTDPDFPDGDTISVSGLTAGTSATPITDGSGVATPVAGNWGSLVLDANGAYTYTPGPAAQGLQQGTTVQDVFTYTIVDSQGNSSLTTITITISGNDDPVDASPDVRVMNVGDTQVSGNTIAPGAVGDQADLDPEGEAVSVVGIEPGNTGGQPVAGTGTPVVGTYGSVVLNPDGSYTYTVDPVAIAPVPQGTNVADVFTYTVTDPGGNLASTTLTVSIPGVNNPPDGVDSTRTISEDLEVENGVPVDILAADFGFTDPDVGDSMSQVTIDSIPDSGSLTLNGAPVTAGQVIPVASLGGLQYTPAPDANNLNLPALPFLTFRVHDSLGNIDPVANRLTIDIIPRADPPVAPVVDYLLPADTPQGDPQTEIPAFPAPSDPDDDPLTITVTALPDPVNGQFMLNGQPVTVGQVLTQAELQDLAFVPNPATTTLPDLSDGNITAGSLLFRVDDGTGRTADGAINIRLVPSSTAIPTGGDPRAPGAYTPPPVVEPSPLPQEFPVLAPDPVAPTGWFYEPGDKLFAEILSEPVELSMLSPIAQSRPWETLQDRLDAAHQARVKAAAEAAIDDDCAPPVKKAEAKPKPKPSAVTRHLMNKPETVKTFSEQIKKQRVPVKVKPRKPARIC